MITEVQRQRRVEGIGSSDVAAILGVSPYASAYDIWLEKTGGLLPPIMSEAAELGDAVESHMVDWATRKLKLNSLHRDAILVHPEYPFLVSNADAIGELDRDIVGIEAKSAGLVGPLQEDQWGEEYTDHVPDLYWTQTQFQMACGGLAEVYVPALLSGRGRVMYKIPRDEQHITMVVPLLVKFWRVNVLEKSPPLHTIPNAETIARIRRQPKKVVPIDPTLCVSWLQAREARLGWEKEEENRKLQMLAALGDAEGGAFPGGELTYFENHRRGFTVNPSSFRVARIRKAPR